MFEYPEYNLGDWASQLDLDLTPVPDLNYDLDDYTRDEADRWDPERELEQLLNELLKEGATSL